MRKESDKRGRPSNLDSKIAVKHWKGRSQHVPPKEVCTDQIVHWPVINNSKMRCKYPNCNAKNVMLHYIYGKKMVY